MQANRSKKTTSKIIECIGTTMLITLPKTSPRRNKYTIKRIVRKSKRILLPQYLHSLLSQKGDGKISISHIFTVCLWQCGHRKNVTYFPSAREGPTLQRYLGSNQTAQDARSQAFCLLILVELLDPRSELLVPTHHTPFPVPRKTKGAEVAPAAPMMLPV